MYNTISSRQLWVLCGVCMLSPFLRLVPGTVAELAGKAGWVSAGLSLIPALFLAWMLGKFSTKGGIIVGIFRCLGRFWGSVTITLWGIWMVFHSGFVLRSGADRFTDTIYPDGGFAVMIVVTGILCAIAAMGHIKPMARASEVFWPMMLFVIVLVIVFSIKDIEPTFLLPVRWGQTRDILLGVPIAAEAVSVALLLGAFCTQYLQPGARVPRLWLKLLLTTVLNVLVCVVAIGNLGSAYTGGMEYPGFILARDLSILSGVERVESLIVGLWLLPDFVLVTVELILAEECFKAVKQAATYNNTVATIPQSALPTAPFAKGGQVFLAAIAILLAFRMAPTGQSLREISTKIMPAFQLIWAYWVIPTIFIIGKLRKKF